MADKIQPDKVSDKDRLLTRPDEPLAVEPDPKAPRGGPADPKTKAKGGQGTDPTAQDLEHTV